VTTWVDAGSAGAYSFPGFRRYAVEGSRARILAFLNIATIGLIARTYELGTLDYCDVDLGATIVEANRDVIVGIKARIDRDTTRGTGLEPLRRARQLAWIIHENIHRIGLVADGGLAGSQSPLWTPKSALRPLQPVYRGGCSARCGQSD